MTYTRDIFLLPPPYLRVRSPRCEIPRPIREKLQRTPPVFPNERENIFDENSVGSLESTGKFAKERFRRCVRRERAKFQSARYRALFLLSAIIAESLFEIGEKHRHLYLIISIKIVLEDRLPIRSIRLSGGANVGSRVSRRRRIFYVTRRRSHRRGRILYNLDRRCSFYRALS